MKKFCNSKESGSAHDGVKLLLAGVTRRGGEALMLRPAAQTPGKSRHTHMALGNREPGKVVFRSCTGVSSQAFSEVAS
jgi:hypothetical protein